ncbi:MAG: DUF3800 domain-containing protein [Bacteroides sp.]|jgi:hypothetical protein|nr:DUF3800 domain-containing protein [Bacteroides sp.]
MDKMFAYLDECGAYGFNFSTKSNSTKFIVVAVLVKETDVDSVKNALSIIREEEFSGEEIKSNRIKGNQERRIKILNRVLHLPFNILALVVDKKSLFADSGIYKSKKTFYKFINQLIYKELRASYQNIRIITDKVGEHEFADEFTKYVKEYRQPISLFDEEEFDVVDSKSENAVQLADLIAGTLSYVYEDNKKKTVPANIDYKKMLDKKLLSIKFFPQSYDENLFEHLEGDDSYNKEIVLIAYRKAAEFIKANDSSEDEDIRRQVFTLNYLLFRFKYNNLRRYIPTKELMSALNRSGYSPMSEQAFRNKVFGKLRDEGIIISSSPKGYKLPSTEREICDYYQHVGSVVLPMIHRLQICNDLLKLSSADNTDYLQKGEFSGLQAVVNAIKEVEHK